MQLNRKYDFFSGARACMDLCAAPGGWLQVAVKYMPMSSTIVGVDLAPIKAIRGCTTFVDDITTQSCRAQLKRVTPDGVKYDVVMHDGAPNVGGNFAAESYTQAALTLDSLRYALHCILLALVPVRPRSRGERRSLRTFAVASLRPPTFLSIPTLRDARRDARPPFDSV